MIIVICMGVTQLILRHQIIPTPMNIHRMEKKVSNSRYDSISSIMKDMQLIRDNAHAYNTGKENIEVRLSVP